MKILLDEIMRDKKLTYRKIGYLTGIPRSTLWDICNNNLSITLAQLEIIAKGLNVRITDLFDSDYK